MESIVRGLVVYAFLLIIFRIAGKRSLAEMTSFDLVLLLIISEVTQQAMVDNDHSIMNGALLIITLVGADILLSWIKEKLPLFGKLMDDVPLIVVVEGKPLKDRMNKVRIDEEDVLVAARQIHGISRLDQIKYAVIEASGQISIIPYELKPAS